MATTARPTELPQQVRLQLEEPAARRVDAEAKRYGNARVLWTRAALEAQRQLERAAALLGADTADVIHALDEASARKSSVSRLDATPLAAYARALRNLPSPPKAADRSNELVLSVPDELAGAWALEAERRGASLHAWASELLLAAPTGALAWEAAAAARYFYLGEWILTESLAAISLSASPQARLAGS